MINKKKEVNCPEGRCIMLKCASVYTYEVDNQEIALNDIKEQLDEKVEMLENTIGIVMCHPEFISSGMLQFICSNLPFDTVGGTSAAQAVNGEAGELILTIFIITSDEVRFKAGVTDCLEECVDTAIKAAYENVSNGESEQPKLALMFPPILLKHAGDEYVKALQSHIPETPLFGTLAIDDTPTFSDSETIYNGESSKNKMSFVLCYGNINPRFFIGTIPEENTMPYKGEVTSSTGPLVHEINDMNAYKYFASIGFEADGVSSVNYLFLPFSIDQKARSDYDGIPVIRVLNSFTEEGSAIFHGNVDEGSTFTLLKCESEDVLSTAKEKVEIINEMSDVNGVLLFSCIVRRIVTMNDNYNEEFENVRDLLRPDIPFMMGCAGGEICPTQIKDGIPTNRYHNYSLIILAI